jgi:hypothetical protein
MKKLLSILFLLVGATTTYIQAQPNRTCSTDEVHKRLLNSNPRYKTNREAIERHVQNQKPVRTRSESMLKDARAIPVITIPVVVHVVYNTAAENISDAQILSQIDVLNKDFRMLNSDIGSVPPAFAGLAADCRFQFCMAQIDPNGNPTNGIVRVPTTRSNFISDDAVKSAATGGTPNWDCNRYLNIWVCDLMGSLGYASFPGSPANLDGIVVTYVAFGINPTLTFPPYNLGRTATHEIGHWMNLLHISGDDGTACTGSDRVDDTPNQAGLNYGCPTFPRVSACSPDANGDMFMNYMDYTNDNCMYMFTLGQKTRMDATFSYGGPRWNLLSSNACNGIGCNAPEGLYANNIGTSTAQLGWLNVSGAINYVLEYKEASATLWQWLDVAESNVLLSGLIPTTSYQFRVTAQCNSGNSVVSSVSLFTTLTPCVTTTTLNAMPSSHTTATVGWSAAPYATQYNLRYKPTSSADGWIVLTTSGTNYSLSSLTPSTQYECQIQSICSSGISDYTASTLFSTPAPPCNPSTSITPSGVSCNSATLSWSADPYGVATSYQYRYKTSASAVWTMLPISTNTVNINGLMPATAYDFQVQSICGSDASAWSSTSNFTTSSPACSDTYEANNRWQDAKTIAINGCVGAKIDKGNDKDFYRITTTSTQPNLRITLSNLPFNYNLILYASNGTTILKSSTLSSTSTETIIHNAAVGATYFIYVAPASSTQFSNTNCYFLSVAAKGSAW